jgi:hypothetical protein
VELALGEELGADSAQLFEVRGAEPLARGGGLGTVLSAFAAHVALIGLARRSL